jgi:hypothetical protein
MPSCCSGWPRPSIADGHSTTPSTSAEQPDVLDPEELQQVASQFGVSEAQVLRDHLISHLLSALSTEAADSVIFFGGTALTRSIVPDGRLSEDVDLLAVGPRGKVAEQLATAIRLALRREWHLTRLAAVPQLRPVLVGRHGELDECASPR